MGDSVICKEAEFKFSAIGFYLACGLMPSKFC